MTVAGIIAEYDPFHNGHLHHLRETVRLTGADGTIAVMSGSFTQRGEPAAFDKWARAEMAIQNGVDLVIELPFYYACNRASAFADGAIGLLDGLGVVDVVSFGSESGDCDDLSAVARYLCEESGEFQARLKKQLEQGKSYALARAKAVAESLPEYADLLDRPNNLLGVEYLISLYRRQSRMQAVTVKRQGAAHRDRDIGGAGTTATDSPAGSDGRTAIDPHSGGAGTIATDWRPSATAVRQFLFEGGSPHEWRAGLPEPTREIVARPENRNLLRLDAFFTLLAERLLFEPKERARHILTAGEGLENRLRNALDRSDGMAGLIRQTQTRRYTEARIRRLVAHWITGLTKEAYERAWRAEASYARVLGMSDTGQTLLRRIVQTNSRVPVVITLHGRKPELSAEAAEMLDFDVRVSELCHLLRYGELGIRSEHRRKPFRKTEKALDFKPE